jgi:hypothetical protein
LPPPCCGQGCHSSIHGSRCGSFNAYVKPPRRITSAPHGIQRRMHRSRRPLRRQLQRLVRCQPTRGGKADIPYRFKNPARGYRRAGRVSERRQLRLLG